MRNYNPIFNTSFVIFKLHVVFLIFTISNVISWNSISFIDKTMEQRNELA